jgi:hypothetical protein
VTLVWTLVVGATGVVNTLADVLLQVWQSTEIAAMVKPYEGQPPPATLASMEQSVAHARAVQPGMKVGLHRLSGHALRQLAPLRHLHARRPGAHRAPVQAGAGRRRHRPGDGPAHAALVSERAAAVAAAALWRLRRRGMQFLWALLDLATIVVLGSGLYLWWKRGRAAAKAAATTRPVRVAAAEQR